MSVQATKEGLRSVPTSGSLPWSIVSKPKGSCARVEERLIRGIWSKGRASSYLQTRSSAGRLRPGSARRLSLIVGARLRAAARTSDRAAFVVTATMPVP